MIGFQQQKRATAIELPLNFATPWTKRRPTDMPVELRCGRKGSRPPQCFGYPQLSRPPCGEEPAEYTHDHRQDKGDHQDEGR
jgi:hypothetical protein